MFSDLKGVLRTVPSWLPFPHNLAFSSIQDDSFVSSPSKFPTLPHCPHCILHWRKRSRPSDGDALSPPLHHTPLCIAHLLPHPVTWNDHPCFYQRPIPILMLLSSWEIYCSVLPSQSAVINFSFSTGSVSSASKMPWYLWSWNKWTPKPSFSLISTFSLS